MKALANMHFQSWLALVSGDDARCDALQNEIYRRAAQCGVDTRFVDAANGAVLNEITDMIVTRFRRAAYSKAVCAQALLDAGERLLGKRHHAG